MLTTIKNQLNYQQHSTIAHYYLKFLINHNMVIDLCTE
jgi:hypothetical protein